MQRILSDGATPIWSDNGFPLSALPDYQAPEGIVPDGSGGVLTCWVDYRPTPAIYVQRTLPDGSIALGWTANGVAATLAQSDNAAIVADGEGGAFLVWEDSRDYAAHNLDVYAQHLLSDGTVAPGWPTNGVPVCTESHLQAHCSVLLDGSGGVIATWADFRTGVGAIFGQHLLADGSVGLGWTPGGQFITPGIIGASVGDASGGFYSVGATQHPSFAQADLYVQRMSFSGLPNTGWPTGGLKVCGASGSRELFGVVPDGLGGVLLDWVDYRPPAGSGIYALRVQPNGGLAPGWTTNGSLISNPPQGEFREGYSPLAADGLGGAYAVWRVDQQDAPYGQPGFIQHVTGSGAIASGWPSYGLQLSTSLDQDFPAVTSDAHFGAIVAWSENFERFGIFAQRYQLDGPVAVELALVGAELREGYVALDWFSAGTTPGATTLYRRTETSAWSSIATLQADGTGHLRYDDHAVAAGTRYGYRLGYVEDGAERFTTETWVDVPSTMLSLEGLRPNPASGPLSVSFALPNASPASLEVLDVSGRRILQRDVGSMGAGSHVVRLDEGSGLSPGIYWLRLRQGPRALLARGAVVR
ncbi:MAG TPA: T9SS type A sorting domain-containing protein [Candidatus Saccharimonadaceae bacterium]|nr:T9SS type A sorting domain-containing protein [Candidatus Saccharimonadaceae bacterium]